MDINKIKIKKLDIIIENELNSLVNLIEFIFIDVKLELFSHRLMELWNMGGKIIFIFNIKNINIIKIKVKIEKLIILKDLL